MARLDADDVAEPDWLLHMVALMDRRPEVALAATWFVETDPEGRLLEYGRPPSGCGLRALSREALGEERVHVESCGNVLSAIAFLTGMAAEELSSRELEERDPFFPLLITVCARR